MDIKLVYKVIKIFFIKFSSFIFLYPLAIIVSRSLGTQGYGLYGFITAVSAICMVFATMGSDQMLVKNIAARYNADKSTISTPISVTFALCCVTTSVIIALLVLLYAISGEIVWLYILLVTPLMMLRKILISIARGIDRAVSAKFSEDIIQPTVCLLIVSIGYFIFRVELWQVIMAIVFSYLASCLYLIFLIRDQWHLYFSKFSLADAKYWTVLAIPFLGMAVSNSLMVYADRLMLVYLQGYSEAGIYLVAARNASLVMVCFNCLQYILNPKIASMELKDIKSVQAVALLHVVLLVLFGAVAACTLLVFSDFILALFGEHFSGSKLPMIILIAFYFIMFFGGAPVQYLFMTGYEKLGIKILLASLVLNIILNLILIPLFGSVGAAIATGTSLLIKTIIGGIVFYRVSGVHTDLFSILWKKFISPRVNS